MVAKLTFSSSDLTFLLDSSSILNSNRCFSCWRKKLKIRLEVTSPLPFSATSCSLCGQSLRRDTSSAREVDDDDEEQDIRQWRPIEKPKATQSRTTRNLWKLWNEDWVCDAFI